MINQKICGTSTRRLMEERIALKIGLGECNQSQGSILKREAVNGYVSD